MTGALVRKARQVLEDPVLRRWLCRRLIGLEKSPAGFTMGHPPYLGEPFPDEAPNGSGFPTGKFSTPDSSLEVPLPGETVTLDPGEPGALFDRRYRDLETQLSAHRFAWVPIAGPRVDADWVDALWRIWADHYGTNRTGWPWHAYTAAERAINIIDFARRFGLPGDPDATVALLAAHAAEIRDNLEYFGDHYTSNHLSNNGRGLLRIGTALGMPEAARTGAEIMIAEAGRIFGRSGILREGSTHYHVLLTRNYIDAWLNAETAGIDQASLLREISVRALAAIPGLCLPGGMPLIGDISPDASPDYFQRLIGPDGRGGGAGWVDNLSPDSGRKLSELAAETTPVSPDRLAEDGWHRFGSGDWQALTFAPPDGWPPMPGHGHHDLGGFELHHDSVPVIVDPGRGSYGDGEYETATVHSGITVDGQSPTPENRPYYSDAFRHMTIGSPPLMTRTRAGHQLTHSGFTRLKGLGLAIRTWDFDGDAIRITDRIDGRGQHRLSRRFFLAGRAKEEGGSATIVEQAHTYKISGGVPVTAIPKNRWAAYGESTEGTIIIMQETVDLPHESTVTIERS